MILNVKGHSGFIIDILKSNDSFIVRKSSPTSNLNQRLKDQCTKQKEFKSYKNFTSPQIINEGVIDNLYYFDSLFIYGYDVSQFLQIYDVVNLEKLLYSLIDFIKNNIDNSTNKNVIEEFIKKYELTKTNIKLKHNFNFEKIDDLFYSYKEINIPIGYCHGDLTLSNLILSRHGECIYLIDFLDTFINSPLNDIVKLRQDTQFHWSINMIKNKNVDLNKIRMILSWFDTYITKFFSNYNFYKQYYKPFQILNLLRVLQYSDKDIARELEKAISVLYES